MRVLMVTPYFPPHIGGLEKFVYKLSLKLFEKGLDVEVLTTDNPRGGRVDLPFRVHRVHPGVTLMKNPISLAMLSKLTLAKEFDIVHTHVDQAFTTNIFALGKFLHRKPVVIHCHGLYHPESIIGAVVNFLYYSSLGLWSLRAADMIVTLSKGDKDFMVHKLGISSSKVNIIPNAIDRDDYVTDIDASNFVMRHGLDGRRILLYVGALVRRKGLGYLLRAMKDVVAYYRDTILVIIGEGEHQRGFRRMAKKLGLNNSVVFLGHVGRRELFEALSVAEVFVLPSLLEGMPTVILEAFLYGKPVVATRIPGVVDYFDDYALLVPPADENALAKAIVELLGDKELQKKLRCRGRRVVETKFSWDKVSSEIIKLYMNLL